MKCPTLYVPPFPAAPVISASSFVNSAHLPEVRRRRAAPGRPLPVARRVQVQRVVEGRQAPRRRRARPRACPLRRLARGPRPTAAATPAPPAPWDNLRRRPPRAVAGGRAVRAAGQDRLRGHVGLRPLRGPRSCPLSRRPLPRGARPIPSFRRPADAQRVHACKTLRPQDVFGAVLR